MTPARRILQWLLYAAPLILALLLYGYALRLPYFLDDGPHFQILGQTDGWEHWGDFAPFPFYRPLTFTVWKAFEWVFGGYPAPLLHAVNVLAFGLSGVLVGQIARRLTPAPLHPTAAVIAGSGFVLFPFSYQGVAMVAAAFHLTLTLGLVLALHLAFRWLDAAHQAPPLALYLAAFVALFSHETGVLIALLLPAGMLAIRPHPQRRWLWVVLPVWLLASIYLIAWAAFSPNEDTNTLSSDLPAALASLLQGLAYPLAALLRPLVTSNDAEPLTIIGAVNLGVALVAGVALALSSPHRRRIARALGFGLVWYLLGILPAALLLDPGYVLGQTRLALFASAGGAIFWAGSLATLLHHRFTAPLALLWLGLGLTISVGFLSDRRADFERLATWNADAVALLRAQDVLSTGAVLLNAPMNLTPLQADRRFLIGTEGVLWTDPSIDYSQQFWMNSGLEIRDVTTASHPATLRAVGIAYTAQSPARDGEPLYALLRDATQIYATHFDGSSFWPVRVKPPDLHLPEADVSYPESGIRLVSGAAQIDLERVTTWLHYMAGEPAPLKLYVHVTCDGVLVAQSDGYAWGDAYPFRAWQPGETVYDQRTIPLPDGLDPDCLNVLTGLYDENTGQRQSALHDRVRLSDDSYTLPLVQQAP